MATRGPRLKVLTFEPHGDRFDLGKRWERWLERFERDLKYNGIEPSLSENSEKAQMALLIYAGAEVEDIHNSLPTPVKPEGLREENWTEYRKSKEKLNEYFLPQRSNDFALFELMRTKPVQDERTRNYAARLRKAAEKCNFENWSSDKMIKCLIISNMDDKELRLSCLQKEMTLDKLLEKAEKKEDATTMSKEMQSEDNVKKIGKRFPNAKPQRDDKTPDDEECDKCGYPMHSNISECPATNRECNYCKKMGHFAKVCQKKSIKTITENPGVVSDSTDTDSDYDLIAYIRDAGIQHKEPKLLGIKVNGFPLSWEADTGATRDLMSEEQFQDYERQIGHRICLSPTRTKLFAFGSSKSLTILGHFKAQLGAGAKAIYSTIVVTKEPSNYPLLSRSTLEPLSLVGYNQQFVVKGPKQYNDASS